MGNPILAGLGFSLPKRQVSNHDLVGRINTSDEFIVERTGVRTRYHVEPEQAVSALMVPAARQAIEAAGLLPEDIDLLLVNTLSPDHHDPSQACLIQPLLGLRVGVRRLRATGQRQQRDANRRAEGECPCLFSCHCYLSRFYSCGLSSSISISNCRRGSCRQPRCVKKGAATSGTTTLAVSGKGANRVCRAASKARACPWPRCCGGT